MANNRIQFKRTSTSGLLPNTTNSANASYIAAGEFAVNLTDKRVIASDGSLTFEVGSNLTSVSISSFAALDNNAQLRFKTLNGNTVGFRQQNDDNFVFYTTNTAGGERPVFAIFANTVSSNLSILAPTVFNTNVYIGALSANGSLGAEGQVLTSNGTSVYWSSAGGGSFSNGTAYTWSAPQTYNANISLTGNTTNLITVGGNTINATTYSGTALTANNATNLGGSSLATIQGQITGNAATAYTNAVAAAATDASTKAGTAYTNAVAAAATDASTKAGTAYTNAVAAAATDASTKAGTAYTNAVAIAATDASTKAGTAYSNAIVFAANASNANNGTLAEARLPYRMDQNLRTTDSPIFANGSFTGSLAVGGDLTITGNLISTNVQSLAVADPLMKLGVNNPADTYWGGFTFHYSGSGNTTNHAGLVRSPTTKEFILMSTFGDETAVANNNTINIADPSFSYANLQVNLLKVGSNSTVFSTINTTSFSGTSNNSTNFGGLSLANVQSQITGNAATAYTNAVAVAANATNLASGTVAFARLPSLFVGTTQIQSSSAAQALSGITTLAAGNTTITGSANVSTTLQVGTNTATFGTAAYIVANGNIGIGNSAPSSKIHTFGDANSAHEALRFQNPNAGNAAHSIVRFFNDVSQAGFYFNSSSRALDVGVNGFGFYNDATGGNLQFRTPGAIIFQTASSNERVRIAANGNIGIGTSSPSVTLDVNGAIQFGGTIGKLQNESGFGTLRTTSSMRIATDANGIDYSAAGYGHTWYINSVQSMFLDGSRNLSIGNTSPSYKLDVFGGDIRLANNATYIRSVTSSGATVRMLGINSSNDAYVGPIDPGPISSIFNASNTSGIAAFYTSGTEKMRITSAGNIGIGTTSPQAALHIVGTQAIVQGSASAYTLWKDGTPTKAWQYAIASGTDDSTVRHYDGASWIDYLRFSANGNVGIGNTTPANKLSVGGTLAVSGISTFSANVILGSSGLSANGGFGTAGQTLHSNGTATYWAADDQGVTSVATANGLSGGPITSTGTIGVVTGSTLTVNTAGIHVNSALSISSFAVGNSFVANSTGIRISSNSTFIQDLSIGTGYITGVLGYSPEAGITSHPFLTNDLANGRLRGMTLGANTNVSLSNSNFDVIFDATPTVISGFANTTANTVLEFTNLPNTLQYGSFIGISFGSGAWAPTSLTIEALSNGAWVSCYSNTSIPAFTLSQLQVPIPGNAGNGTTAIKFTMGANTSTRIDHIWAYDYNSDGWSHAAMPRSGGAFYGNVILGSVGLSANGGFGSAGQTLHSNGSATYWAADDDTNTTYDLLAVANTAVNAG
jgi:hypothetical protein